MIDPKQLINKVNEFLGGAYAQLNFLRGHLKEKVKNPEQLDSSIQHLTETMELVGKVEVGP